jgi:sRNA-binding carbon storage regulator CsrA
MLVITRREGEAVVVHDKRGFIMEVRVRAIKDSDRVRLEFHTPHDFTVRRKEVEDNPEEFGSPVPA